MAPRRTSLATEAHPLSTVLSGAMLLDDLGEETAVGDRGQSSLTTGYRYISDAGSRRRYWHSDVCADLADCLRLIAPVPIPGRRRSDDAH
jgi:hypothetical protein